MNDRTYDGWAHDTVHDRYFGNDTHSKHVDRLPPGYYSPTTGPDNNPTAGRIAVSTDPIFKFPIGAMPDVLAEIARFWSSADRYAELGVTHKRGILLKGAPGCGKSVIVRAAIEDVIGRGGIALRCPNYGLEDIGHVVAGIRKINGAGPILVVVEDIDEVADGNETDLLSLMDSSGSLGGGILWIATTNDADKVPDRIKGRPSRIDTIVEVELPAPAERLAYLKFLVRNDIRAKINLEPLVAMSEGLSLAAVKELLLAVAVHEQKLDAAVSRLRDAEGLGEYAEEVKPDIWDASGGTRISIRLTDLENAIGMALGDDHRTATAMVAITALVNSEEGLKAVKAAGDKLDAIRADRFMS